MYSLYQYISEQLRNLVMFCSEQASCCLDLIWMFLINSLTGKLSHMITLSNTAHQCGLCLVKHCRGRNAENYPYNVLYNTCID